MEVQEILGGSRSRHGKSTPNPTFVSFVAFCSNCLCFLLFIFWPVLAMVRAEAQDQVSVRAGSASAGRVEARWAEAPDLAVLAEDHQEGKEHQEFARA
jgi:hypothetical protein